METICMKCQNLFSGEKVRKSMFDLSSAEYAQRVVRDKYSWFTLYLEGALTIMDGKDTDQSVHLKGLTAALNNVTYLYNVIESSGRNRIWMKTQTNRDHGVDVSSLFAWDFTIDCLIACCLAFDLNHLLGAYNIESPVYRTRESVRHKPWNMWILKESMWDQA